MEHLTYYPRTEVRQAESDAVGALDVLAVQDWTAWDQKYGFCEHTEPVYEWLGLPHDRVDDDILCQDLDDYSRKHDMLTVAMLNDYEDPAVVRKRAARENVDYQSAMEAIIAFSQSWLYIGVLEICLQKKLKQSFVNRTTAKGNSTGSMGNWRSARSKVGIAEQERDVLYTRLVPYSLWQRGRKIETLSSTEREATQAMITKCFRQANRLLLLFFLMGLKLLEQEGSCEKRLGRLTLRAIRPCALLMDSIHHTLVYSKNRMSTPYLWLKLPTNDLLPRNWCPNLLSWAGNSLGISCMEWLVATGLTEESKIHRDCNEQTCIQNNVDLDEYKTLHVTAKCICQPVLPRLEDVASALRKGLIPVMKFSGSDSEIEVLYHSSFTSNPEYVAFSHVWSHGLGSSTERGLPFCQVQRLSEISRKTASSQDVCFWIDSLCIPKEPELRKLAISLMTDTYKGALATVVLDDTIAQVKTSAHWSSRAWAILSSAWMRRLWTFQEAILSKRLHFLARDGFIDSETLIGELNTVKWLYPVALQFFQILVTFFDKSHSSRTNLHVGVLLTHMSSRSTSKFSDELLSFGGLLGLPLDTRSYELSEEDRWKRFYLRVAELPWDIVFDTRPKMKTVPFKWAPFTFLERGTYLAEGERVAKCCESGLKVKMSAILLEQAISPNSRLREFYQDNETTGRIHCWLICHVRTEEPDDHFYLLLRGTEELSLPEVKLDALIVHKFDYKEGASSSVAQENPFMVAGVKSWPGREDSSGLRIFEVMVTLGSRFVLIRDMDNWHGFSDLESIRGSWIDEEILLV